jgi:uncharacterized BrkB/YihY/UPF0761 family membrane protein
LGLGPARPWRIRVSPEGAEFLPSINDPPTEAPSADEPPDHTLPGRAERARLRGLELYQQLEAKRPEHASIEIGFRWLIRDKEIAGGVLGGGLAYRFFFWIMALAVLAAGGLGFASSSGSDVAEEAHEAGLTDALANTVAKAAEQSETGRWWLVIVGAWLFLWFSFGLLRALRLVHAAAWHIPLPPLRNAPQAVAAVVAAPVILFVVTAGAGWLRTHSEQSLGLLASVLVGVLFGATWFWISRKLPAPEGLHWTAFLPGAVLLGIGIEALHLFTVYYLETKLANASELYGVLGLATTALFYFFLVGRGVVWAAEANAVVWDVRIERRGSG